MSKLKSLGRKLKPNRVDYAIKVHDKRRELAHNLIRERAAKDKEFAQDIINAVGDGLPSDIREIADKTIAGVSEVSDEKLQEVLDDVSKNH